MSVYDRSLPSVTVTAQLADWTPRGRCFACGQSMRPMLNVPNAPHDAATVWATLDEDRCPVCRSLLVLRDKEPLQFKCAIARRLLDAVGC